MSEPLSIKLDISKLDQSLFFKGEKGTYVDLILWFNEHGPDKFGNLGSIQQALPKEMRQQGKKGAYVGNAKPMFQKQSGGGNWGNGGNQRQQAKPQQKAPDPIEDDWDSNPPF